MPADATDGRPDASPEPPGSVRITAPTAQRNDRRLAAVAALRDVDPVPGSAKPDYILVADGVIRRFGGLTAVDVGHIEVQRGSITALIGPNGAGKSTFFNLLTGFDSPDEGTFSFNGQSLTGVASHKVARRGMVGVRVRKDGPRDRRRRIDPGVQRRSEQTLRPAL